MRITWCSDIHLEFCDKSDRERIFMRLNESPGEAVLLTGDIASNNRTAKCLEEMYAVVERPIYFVLGNHDAYGATFRDVTSSVDALRARNPGIVRLDLSGPIPLGGSTCLIGHGGWACGTTGIGIQTPVQINDERCIPDLRPLDKPKLFARMRWMAQQSADHIAVLGDRAAREFRTVWIATHAPPFPESCTYEGKRTDENYLPHFCNALLGKEILRLASTHPETQFRVFCGHTHGAALHSPRSNLQVHTTAAEYRSLAIAALLDTEALL